MTGKEGTCKYAIDREDPDTWGRDNIEDCAIRPEILNDEDKWECPHSSEGENEYCIFHQDNKNNQAAVKKLIKSIKDENVDSEFLGAKFDELDLSDLDRLPNSESGIDLTQVVVDGDVYLSNIKIESEIYITQSCIEGELNLYRSEFDGKFDASDSEINNRCRIFNCVFNEALDFGNATIFRQFACVKTKIFGEASFGAEYKDIMKLSDYKEPRIRESTTFHGPVHFGNAHFHDDIISAGIDFKKSVTFHYADIEGVAYFYGSIFRELVTFSNSNFFSTAEFTAVKFQHKSKFENSEFKTDSRFRTCKFKGDSDFVGSHFTDEVIFRNSDFYEIINFTGIEFPINSDFSETTFYNGCKFDGCHIAECDFSKSDLTGGSFNNTNMKNSNFESAILSRATLFGADLRGAKLSGSVLGDVRIDDDTQFLGHASDESDISPHTLTAIFSRPTCIYDPDYEVDNDHSNEDKAKSVYRALEELGGKFARSRLQARSFVRRQDINKNEYKQVMLAGEEDDHDDGEEDPTHRPSLEERFIAGARYSRAKIARVTLLYGESPWRVMTWSVGFILSFALLYPLEGWIKATNGSAIIYGQFPPSLHTIGDSLYYSTLTYTALGFGDFQPVGLGRVLTTLETGFGAVMLALLVFILGRRAAR